MPTFTTKQIEDLNSGRDAMRHTCEELREQLCARTFTKDSAKEYARHGLGRRLGIMARCIDRVFDVLAPEQDELPEKDALDDATIHIQAFVLNVFGCCDNLAWIWVLEKDIRIQQGSKLSDQPKWIGLGPKFIQVRASFSQPFQDFLKSRDPWFDYLKDFRDALAHRIALYIPPYIIPPAQEGEYLRLQAAMNEAMGKGDVAVHDRLESQQRALVTFLPVTTHSPTHGAKSVALHFQLLADFSTIDEITRKLLVEMDRPVI